MLDEYERTDQCGGQARMEGGTSSLEALVEEHEGTEADVWEIIKGNLSEAK